MEKKLKKTMTFWQKVSLALFGANCPNCYAGRLSRQLTGFGKKAQCTNCGKVTNVNWL